MRSLLRDRAVLAGIGLIGAFAVAFIVFSVVSRQTELTDQREVAAARDQIERTHDVVRLATLSAEDSTVGADIAAVIEALERTHRGLLFGDRGLRLPGVEDPRIELAFTEAEPGFARLIAAASAAIDGPSISRATAVGAAGDAYRERLAPIAAALSGDARVRTIRNDRLQLAGAAVWFSLSILVIMISANRKQRLVANPSSPGPGDLDQLTGLIKRAALREHLIDVVHRRRHGDGFVALVRIGVEVAGSRPAPLPRRSSDRARQEIARRIRMTVRSTDLAARTGRDEFAVVIESCPRAADAGRVADKLVQVFRAPIAVGSDELTVRVAAGIALSPLDATTADELLDRAAIAQRAAANVPEPGYEYFSDDLRPVTGSRAQLTESLREALGGDGQLWIAFQPKIRLDDMSVIGYEALIRWLHPTLGNLEPDEFIPVAEESDLIIDLGHWVVDAVCRQLAAWGDTEFDARPVSINVSTRQFRHGDLTEIVAAALARHSVSARLVEIEITEGVLIDEDAHPLANLEELRALGVRIAVDDFGTGYSSLSYLKRLPIDTLKIDRSFVRELSAGSEDAAISTAIIALGHNLGLEVVAEGVETQQQLEILEDLGCDAAQGFYFAQPLPASDVTRRELIRTGSGA